MATKAIKEPEPTNADPVDVPGVTPPDGVKARVKSTVEYDLNVDPDNPATARRARRFVDNGDDDDDDLINEAALALEPPDPLSAFLEEWNRFAGYTLQIIRLPDPATRRMPGNQYAKPCFELERIGDVPFDPVNFIPMLQMVNGNSGGVFRVFITDHNGAPIPGARLERLAIADPPGGSGRATQSNAVSGDSARYGYAPAPATVERPLSPMEKQMQSLQTRLLENALERALNPPQPPPPQAPQLSPEQQLAMAVFTHSDLLGNVITKVANAVQAPDIAERSTWKDKLIDLATQNPTLVARVNDTIGRVADRIFSGPPQPQPYMPPPPTQHTPRSTPAATPTVADNLPTEAPIDDEESEEDQDMALLEDIVDLLSGDEPISFDNPVFKELETDYPRRFMFYVDLISRTQDAEQMLTFIAKLPALPPVYLHALTGPMREHYRVRAEQLRSLCIISMDHHRRAAQPQPTPQPQPVPTAPTTDTPPQPDTQE